MSEIGQNIAEKDEHTVVVPYEDWHPPIGNALWERLEVPGQELNGSFNNPAAFDSNELWNADATYLVSHHEFLNYWNQKLSVAFAIEHYLHISRIGSPSPKVLEIGLWPMSNPIVSTEYGNTVMAILAQNNNVKVVGVDNIDLSTVFPYQTYTPPNFGNGVFINGDFHDVQVKRRIIKTLGGNPDVIVGNMVFEKGLGRYTLLESQANRRSAPLLRGFTGLTTELPKMHEVAEELAIDANSFLGLHGVLVISNGGGSEIPDFVHTMPLLAVYLDESGKRPYAQVRARVQ